MIIRLSVRLRRVNKVAKPTGGRHKGRNGTQQCRSSQQNHFGKYEEVKRPLARSKILDIPTKR